MKKYFAALLALVCLAILPACDKDSGIPTPEPPVQPDKPSQPDKPDTPDEPDTPDVPDTPDTPDTPDNPDDPSNNEEAWEGGDWMTWPFAKGADVSYVTQMEDEGFKFHHVAANGGGEDELMAILKEDCGVNAIRLRVWVNPDPMRKGGKIYNDKEDVLKKAIRANELGLKLMIDFHFSDYWADPGKQYMPEAWKNYSVAEIKNAITDHVTDILGALRDNGITPKWVQLGNEVSWGMLWNPDNAKGASNSGQPNGDNFDTPQHANFAGYIQTAYDAVKTIDAGICTIVHVTDAYNEYPAKWVFDILTHYNVNYDMIGLSLYPTQAKGYVKSQLMSKYVNPAIANAKNLTTNYGKPVIFAEVGMPWDDAEGSVQMITAIMDAAKTDKNIRGIFYWEPEANPTWEAEGTGKNGYTLGGFNPSNNSPTNALSPFLNNID